jgi:hypothetical protein
MTETYCDICSEYIRKKPVEISVTVDKKWKYIEICKKCYKKEFKILHKIKGSIE